MLGRFALATAAVLAFHLGAGGQDKPQRAQASRQSAPPEQAAAEATAPQKTAKTAAEQPARPKPVLVRDLTDNVRVRLVGARYRETRGQNLIAKFETLEKEPAIRVLTFPAHSFTTHEQTLRAIITGCVD